MILPITTYSGFFDRLLPKERAKNLLAKDINTNCIDSFGIFGITGSGSVVAITLVTSRQTFGC